MNSGLFKKKCYLQNIHLKIIQYTYKQDLALNNDQGLNLRWIDR